jgi:hypothetical protein
MFVYIVVIGHAVRGALAGSILLVAVGSIAKLGAWLLAQPPLPIADLSWKWWIGSMVVTGAISAGGFLAEKSPGEVLPYAREAAGGSLFGMASALICWLVTYTGPKPWTLQPQELAHVGWTIGVAALVGGVTTAFLVVIEQVIRRQFMRTRGVGIGGKLIAATQALLWLVHCVVLLSVGAWILNAEPLPGFSKIVGWCVILLGAYALVKRAAQHYAPAFRTSPQLRNQDLHGDARVATDSEAQQAARGGGRSSVDDRRVPEWLTRAR